jgi:hypothetical protein
MLINNYADYIQIKVEMILKNGNEPSKYAKRVSCEKMNNINDLIVICRVHFFRRKQNQYLKVF